MMQLFVILLCIAGLSLANSFGPDVTKGLFAWSCDSRSLVPCDISHAVCQSDFGRETCRKGVSTYPDLVCMNIVSGDAVNEDFCPYSKRPQPSTCLNSQTCSAYCRPSGHGTFSTCTDSEFWACADADAPACGWFCNKYQRDVACFGHGLEVDPSLCPSLPSTTPSASSNLPKGFGYCPVDSQTTLIASFSEGSSGVLTVTWSPVTEDLPADVVIDVVFNDDSSRNIPATAVPTCSLITESGNADISCVFEFLPAVRYRSARLAAIISKDLMPTVTGFVAEFGQLMFPAFPSASDIAAILKLPSQQIGGAKVTYPPSPPRVEYPEWDSTTVSQQLLTESFDSESGTIEGWFVGSYEGASVTDPVLSDADVEITGVSIILGDNSRTEKSLSFSRSKTKCYLVVGDQWAVQTSDLKDQEIAFDDSLIPHVMSMRPVNQPSILVPGGTKNLAIACSHITGSLLAPTTVIAEVFSETTLYGLARGTVQPTKDPAFDTFVIVGPPNRNADEIFFDISDSGLEYFVAGDAFLTAGGSSISVYRAVLRPENAAILRASLRGYAHIRDKLSDKESWGEEVHVGYDASPMCRFPSGRGSVVQCGVTCGTTARTCGAHGREVEPLFCVNPEWPTVVSRCELPMFDESTLLVRYDRKTLFFSGTAIEMLTSAVIAVDLPEVLKDHIDDVPTCSVTSPLSSEEWCVIDRDASRVAINLPQQNQVFTFGRIFNSSLEFSPCKAEKASFQIYLPNESNDIAHTVVPTTATQLHVHCSLTEKPVGKVLGEPHSIAFAAQTQDSSTYVSLGQLYLSFKFVALNDVPMFGIQSVTISNLGSQLDLSTATSAHIFGGVDVDSILWPFKENSALIDNDVISITSTVTSATLAMDAGDLVGFEGAHSFAVLINGVTLHPGDVVCSPVASIDFGGGAPGTVGTGSKVLTLAKTPAPPVGTPADKSIFVVRIPAPAGRMISAVELSLALGVNNVSYASWQSGTDGSFLLAATVPIEDLWIGASAASVDMLQSALLIPTIRQGQAMSADAIKGTTATVYAPEDYTCRSTNDPYEPAECPVKPLTCYGTVTRTVMCGNATDASDPAFQACRSSPLPEAFQACVKPNAIVSSAVVEETPTSNAPGAIGIKYELDHVWGYSSLRSFEFVVHDRGLFGEISWCWLSVVDKAIPCGRDASGMIRVALPVGLREKNANVRIFRKLVITRSKSISVTLSFVDSRGEQKKEIARADLKTDSDTPMQPTTTSFGGFAPTGDGLITAWTRATSTHDFRPPTSQEITKVLMRFDFVWPEGSIVRCLSSTGDAVVGSGSPWPPHTRTLVSSASGIKILRFSDTNTTDVVFPIFGSDEFTSVYVACIGSPIIDADTLYNVKAFFVSDFVPINHIYAFTPSTGFSGIIDPAAPVANPQQIKNAISFSDAPDHTLSVAATKDLVTKLSGHNDLLMNARVANTKGTATVFLGVSSSLPEFTAFLSGSDAVHLSALSAYVSQALIQDNADGFEVSSSSYSTDEGYAWRCKDSSGMISACVVADRCGEEFESEHVCINLANLPETVRDIDQCVHIPLPSSIDRTNCGVAFKKASSVAFGKDGVAISFEVDVSQMPGVSTFQIQASFPSSEKLFNVECSSSSPSASVACSIATESTSLVTATVSGANIPADAASASSIASLQGDEWGKHTFTIFLKNVIMPTTSTSKVERLTVSTFMPLRPNHDLMSTGTSSLSFNSLRFSSPLVSHVVATFQPFSLNGSGTLAVTVSSPRLRPLFLAELKKINLAVEPSHKITFMHACKISVITQFDRTRWPSGYDQIVTASSTMSDRDMGYDITGFDPVFAPTDITVTCSVNPRGEDFEVRVFFTTTDDQVFRALPRTFGPAYYITPEHLPVMPSVRLLGTKVKLTYPDGPFPADTFDLALLQATQPAFKDYYLDEKDEKSAFFVIQIETNVPASLSHPVYIRHLEGYFKTAFEEPWEKAEIIPYAASTPVGQWYCAKDGAYGACASNGCHGHRGAACFFATKKQSDDSYCLHLKPPSSFDTTHCGELKCYSADGETIVDCDDETVCVRGCQDKKIAITQMATTDPSLAQVCVRSGAVVNSEMFCPRTIVRAGEYELTCAPRSECKILCTDEQGKDEQCSSINSWSTCNGTCSEIGVQSQFTVCTARSSALMGVVDDALCSHIDSGPHTRSCTPQECASWFCSPDGERNLTSCFDDGGYDDCPSSACSDSYSVSRVAVCLKEGNVVSDSECLLQKPDLLKKCPLITSSCEVAFAGECKYDSDGQEDSSFNPDCVNFGSTSTPHEIGVCSDKNGEPVASEWCGDAATVRPCSLPMCESNISYQWVSVPGTCVHANSRCASFRPVAVSCFGKLDEQQIQVSDAFCDENERPPRYVPCEAIEVVHCGAHGKCKTVPAEYEGDALPGIVMGTCECIADNYFGDTCQTRVNFTGTGVSTAQDAITFSWTLNRIVDSHSVRVTLANYDNDVASTTLFVLPASALASRAFTHAEIAGIVKPGRVSVTFSVAGAHITTLFTFNAKCSAVPEVYSCKNNGTCASSGECQCAEGYSGELCETTPCMDRACHGENTAWCSDDEGERTCQCVDYDQTESFFFDDRCISPRDCANKVSCENGGIMTGIVNADTLNVSSCKCICSQNFVGDSCEECYYDGPGVCVNGSPREGCTGCSCNKGFIGTTCSCRFVSAGITISTDAPVDFDDRSSPEARAFFRSLHTAMQYVVGSAVTATIGDVTHKTDTSLLFATILTLSTCDDFVPQAQPAEDDLTILRNALALIKAAFESGRLDDVLPENTRIDKTAGINFDDEPTCEGPDCSPPEPSKPDSSSGSNGLSTGALIGVIVGCAVTAVIVIILLLSCLCGWCCFSKPNSDSAPNEVQMSSTQSTTV